MTNEILTDIVKIVALDMSAHYMVAVVQWRGKIVGRPIYQPTPAELNADREGFMHGMSMIPEPPSDWEAVALEFVPKVNSVVLALRQSGNIENGESAACITFPAGTTQMEVPWKGQA